MYRALAVLLVAVLSLGTLPEAVAQGGGRMLLEDATPVKLRLSRNVSSADAHVGETVDFEVLEEIKIGDVVVVPKGGIAWGSVIKAEPKRRMGKGGKLDMTIDSVRLADGQKAALRGVKETAGGGHTGAMTAGIVATSLIVWPAAPFFLFMHGKDITIPKGTEITAYINGAVTLDAQKFAAAAPGSSPAASGTEVTLAISSTPAGAEIEVDSNFVGSTPSSVGVAPGDHLIRVTKKGYQTWERKLKVSSGTVNVAAELQRR